MPLKPIRFGFKAFLLCEAKTGYVVNWNLYTGKSEVITDIGANRIVCRKLVEGVEGEGYQVFSDRFYTSIDLLVDFAELNIGFCGTIMQNRLQLNEQ